MDSIKIKNGSIPAQTAYYSAGDMGFVMSNGSYRKYRLRDAIEEIKKTSEKEGVVKFRMRLRDGVDVNAHASRATFDKIKSIKAPNQRSNYVLKEMSPIQYKITSTLLAMFVFGAIGCTLFLFSLVLLSEKTDAEKFRDRVEDNKGAVTAMCNKVVEGMLKSPKSANIPVSYKRISVSDEGHTYTYYSYVDAQNSFGADIRTEFVCVMSDKGGHWNLIDFKFLE